MIREKLLALGFSGNGYDGIQMTEEQIMKELGTALNNGQENEYGGVDYNLEEDGEFTVSIEILNGMVHDVMFEN